MLSVVGSHAGESSGEIFQRKIADIDRVGRTYWVICSHGARPDMVQAVGQAVSRRAREALCAFLTASAPGGAVPTKASSLASEYSTDQSNWQLLPAGISPVTGQLTPSTCALVFDRLSLQPGAAADLWHYGDFFDQERPVKIRLGSSTVCVSPRDTSTYPERMKSHFREVLAVGRLAEPFAVWLR